MKLGPFIGGAFGVVGFVLSVFAGLMANNPVESILLRGMMWAAVCYVVGYGVGMISGQVAAEHADKLAKRVAAADAALAEVEAAQEAEAAQSSGPLNAAAAGSVPAK